MLSENKAVRLGGSGSGGTGEKEKVGFVSLVTCLPRERFQRFLYSLRGGVCHAQAYFFFSF